MRGNRTVRAALGEGMMRTNRPYAVDYIAPDGWHHTVVMAPDGAAAKRHVRCFHPERDVRSVKALRNAVKAS